MNMDNDNTIVEYEMLRAEINQKIELVNSLTTFTLTTVVAILTFALTKNYVKGKELNIALIFCTVIPVFLVIWMWFIIKHINDIDGEKQEWIKEWEKVKLNKSLAN